ncbi:hypothetical protein [Salimicrobium humidisoli]|uniref:hypothetical protein n=1 Tax=Salimicrobium humidisoli TaxID=2029857 RepID=UPI001304796B|nr:hypothetical protein [Salimicrobium humidisoli]
MIIKTVAASLIAGIFYTIFMNIFAKKNNIDTSRVYVSGIAFTVIVFAAFLLLGVF